MDAVGTLKSYFGYDSFRDGQEEVVHSILNGRDVLAVMPTGAGKSVCFQVPAMLLPGITLVVSPLISLMKDQVAALSQAGISAAYLNSTLTERQFYLALDNARLGKYKLIYVAPERLLTPRMQEFTAEAEISLVAVDEAHCVSQWGQDFRPSYTDIAAFVNGLPKRPMVAAFTATATPTVREDIQRLLELRSPVEVVTGFDRENLYYEVRKAKKRLDECVALVEAAPGQSGVIYCATRKNVESVCEALQRKGVSATRYHAGLSAEERRQNQEDFTYDRKSVMVATNAFGMGIDKSNVRYVIHFNMPKDMESYYQEAGRAGRDGESARCILLYSPQDMMTNRFLIERDRDTESDDAELAAALKEKAYERLSHMNGYCRCERCLRAYILRYFGEHPADRCGNCVNCTHTFEEVDITEDAQKILSCVKRTGERFGMTLIVQILQGSDSERILDWGLDRQSTYALMKDYRAAQIKERIQALLERDCLTQSEGQYPVLALGPGAGEVLFRGGRVSMRYAEPPEKTKKERRRRSAEAGGAAPTSDLSAALPEGLFERLKALRTVLAREQRVPAYVVFSDASLRDMCERRPMDDEEFLEVSGVGKRKLEQYGEAFMAEIRAFPGISE
ncbi:MAG: DNA helicase RecQ [Clostridia bacterium]|nr:DNA helicase RecQ [Clostridia bacterium]